MNSIPPTRSAPRYSLVRRILFPYSGEEPLTLRQSIRVFIAWLLLVPSTMMFCTLAFTLSYALSLRTTIMLLLITFLSGTFIFGGTGLVVITMSNKAARFRQNFLAHGNQTVDRGGSHGS